MKARFGWALASAMLLGSIGSAYAADMAVKAPPPVVPVDMWTGGYVGLNAGYGWGRDSIGSTAATGPCNTVGFGGCDLPPVNAVSQASAANLTFNNSINRSRFIGGAQAGYNWLVRSGASSWVLGVEADFQELSDSHSNTFTSTAPVPGCPALCATAFVVNQSATLTDKIDTLGTLRGRAGILAGPNTLLYVTGGLAFASATASASFTQTGAPPFGAVNQPFAAAGSIRKELYGGTVGAGVEWKLSRGWSIKAEYLYADLGSISSNVNVLSTSTAGLIYSNATAHINTHFYENIARLGVNYSFAGPVVAY